MIWHPTETDVHSSTDPATGFGDREALFADLREALEPGGVPCVLAVLDLAGGDEYRRINGYLASDRLIGRLAETVADVLAPAARLYRSRQDEFWVLIDGPITQARTLLGAATAALRRAGAEANVSASFGMAFLPAEASDPGEALKVADRELGVARRARERRSSSRSQDRTAAR